MTLMRGASVRHMGVLARSFSTQTSRSALGAIAGVPLPSIGSNRLLG